MADTVATDNRILSRELRLADLVFAQILYVIVLDFFGTAAKAGAAHVVFWMAAIALFFIPCCVVVSHLNQRFPLEGGLYEWARIGFGDAIGFMVGWNLWIYIVMMVAEIGLLTTTYIAYVVGPRAEWIGTSNWLTLASSLVMIALLTAVSILGLRIGKWITNAVSAATIAALVVLIAAAIAHFAHKPPAHRALRLTAPAISLFNVSVFAKMAFGALCGFELVAIFAGECKGPSRNLARSVWLTAPLIALFYILGTAAILEFVRPEQVNLIGPVPQALATGLRSFGLAADLLPLLLSVLLINYVASFGLCFSANTRLPMVAGWDRLAPEWFSRLDRKRRTPVHSTVFIAAITFGFSVVGCFGVRAQEAFQFLQVGSFAFYALAYVVLFSLPLFASRREPALKASLPIRTAAASGLIVTLTYVILSVVPVSSVEDRFSYALKMVLVIAGTNFVGAALYLAACRSRRRASQSKPQTKD